MTPYHTAHIRSPDFGAPAPRALEPPSKSDHGISFRNLGSDISVNITHQHDARHSSCGLPVRLILAPVGFAGSGVSRSELPCTRSSPAAALANAMSRLTVASVTSRTSTVPSFLGAPAMVSTSPWANSCATLRRTTPMVKVAKSLTAPHVVTRRRVRRERRNTACCGRFTRSACSGWHGAIVVGSSCHITA